MVFGRSVVSRVLLELLYLALGFEARGLASKDVYASGRQEEQGSYELFREELSSCFSGVPSCLGCF